MPKSKNTGTSDFGTSGRFSHDSTKFYSGRLYSGFANQKTVKYSETSLPIGVANTIFARSSESMDEIPNSSVHLMVTSPPYNVGKKYDEDLYEMIFGY